MYNKLLFVALIGVHLLGAATIAGAGVLVPDLELSTAETASGDTPVSLFCLPDGSGASFTSAFSYQGGPPLQDATITLHLRDPFGNPIMMYPREDIWLESSGGGLVSCGFLGTMADDHTDYDGVTHWIVPLRASGSSGGELTHVYVAGAPLAQDGFVIQFNSADINGDGTVGLTDVALMAGFYYDSGNPDYAADFWWDGYVNISDVVMFAQGLGATCP